MKRVLFIVDGDMLTTFSRDTEDVSRGNLIALLRDGSMFPDDVHEIHIFEAVECASGLAPDVVHHIVYPEELELPA